MEKRSIKINWMIASVICLEAEHTVKVEQIFLGTNKVTDENLLYKLFINLSIDSNKAKKRIQVKVLLELISSSYGSYFHSALNLKSVWLIITDLIHIFQSFLNNYVSFEFAKLRTFRAFVSYAPYMPSHLPCFRALHAFAPYVPWSLRVLITNVVRLICISALLLTRL